MIRAEEQEEVLIQQRISQDYSDPWIWGSGLVGAGLGFLAGYKWPKAMTSIYGMALGGGLALAIAYLVRR